MSEQDIVKCTTCGHDHEAEMPVEPECVVKMRRLSRGPFSEVEWATLDYIDSLKAYALRKSDEARALQDEVD